MGIYLSKWIEPVEDVKSLSGESEESDTDEEEGEEDDEREEGDDVIDDAFELGLNVDSEDDEGDFPEKALPLFNFEECDFFLEEEDLAAAVAVLDSDSIKYSYALVA